jgi:hypothetical protein
LNGTFDIWYFYNGYTSTAKADYTFCLSIPNRDQLLIDFESKPPGQAFFGDSFFCQVWGF